MYHLLHIANKRAKFSKNYRFNSMSNLCHTKAFGLNVFVLSHYHCDKVIHQKKTIMLQTECYFIDEVYEGGVT